eukprot:gnl/MRDRNA2_/MRDRNA2_154482_c0_seq1.p1 gnl/MRDRNA2_/MRDRNA2_154482_c0~~gnl/MRDRNA2_/MRDRNA2_154482_c0_seq1.p1  ORF type:complete len:167 (-),score=31.21 gnl/MRDRNA2_/MRDRNA2_154482_c0_seq1:46-546(-)
MVEVWFDYPNTQADWMEDTSSNIHWLFPSDEVKKKYPMAKKHQVCVKYSEDSSTTKLFKCLELVTPSENAVRTKFLVSELIANGTITALEKGLEMLDAFGGGDRIHCFSGKPALQLWNVEPSGYSFDDAAIVLFAVAAFVPVLSSLKKLYKVRKPMQRMHQPLMQT